MVRRSFRLGLRLGALLGLVLAVVKVVQARRPTTEGTHPDWKATPRPPATPITTTAPAVTSPPRVVPEPVSTEPVPAVATPAVTGAAEAATPAEEAKAGEPRSTFFSTLAADRAAAETEPRPAAPAAKKAAPAAKKVTPAAKKAAAATKKAAAAKAGSKTTGKRAGAEGAPAAKKAAKSTKATWSAAAWVQPEEGRCPPSHPVKAKLSSRLFHLPGMFAYDRTAPDRCYEDGPSAEADGFARAKR